MCFILPLGRAQNYICNDSDKNNEICECDQDTCYFLFVIEHLQTFTAYERNAARGTRGRVYYIDGNGDPQPANANRDACSNLNDCTPIHTVDGSTYRSFLAINKRIPGPTIIVNEGATVVVDVVNLLTTEETSIHWHGMHQRRTPWMDGVGYITQCPIEAGTSFRYIFNATPAGTFWYHSHSGPQRTDGLFGALIVRENNPPPTALPSFTDLPGQHTLTLLDWQRESSIDLFVQIHSSLGYFEDTNVDEVPTMNSMLYENTCSADTAEVGPIPYWSGIINGKGKHRDVSFSQAQLSTFNVQSGQTYRFRLIGAQGLYAYRFSIDGHKLLLVATDGYFIQPEEVDYIIIHTGERYDFLLTADQGNQVNYLIRAETLEVDCNTLRREGVLTSNDAIAVLLYDGNTVDNNLIENEYSSYDRMCSEQSMCRVANCPFENYADTTGNNCSELHVDELKLLIPTPEDELPNSSEVNDDSTRFFNFGFDSKEFTSTINGRNFMLPSTSLQTQGTSKITSELCQNLNEECDLNEDDCTCVHIVNIDNNFSKKAFRFVFSSLAVNRGFSFAHPIHLHGHSFHVVKVGYGSYSDSGVLESSTSDITCSGFDGERCLKQPQWSNGAPDIEITNTTIRKDTVIIPAGGYVVIDFIADNPGYWFLHCHIESHQLEGMAVVINELESEQNSPPTGIPTCGNFKWDVADFNDKIKDDARAVKCFSPWMIFLLAGITLALKA